MSTKGSLQPAGPPCTINAGYIWHERHRHQRNGGGHPRQKPVHRVQQHGLWQHVLQHPGDGCRVSRGLPYMTSAKFSDFFTPLVRKFTQPPLCLLLKVPPLSADVINGSLPTWWSIRLYTMFCWRQIKSCVSVGYTVKELLFWHLQKVVYNLMDHPVTRL